MVVNLKRLLHQFQKLKLVNIQLNLNQLLKVEDISLENLKNIKKCLLT